MCHWASCFQLGAQSAGIRSRPHMGGKGPKGLSRDPVFITIRTHVPRCLATVSIPSEMGSSLLIPPLWARKPHHRTKSTVLTRPGTLRAGWSLKAWLEGEGKACTFRSRLQVDGAWVSTDSARSLNEGQKERGKAELCRVHQPPAERLAGDQEGSRDQRGWLRSGPQSSLEALGSLSSLP